VSSKLALRIAAVLAFIHCVMHTLGGVFARPQHGAEEMTVIETMKAHGFNVMGSIRSYWDFLFGYGLFVTIFLLSYAFIFWYLGTATSAKLPWTRPILVVLSLNFMAMAVVSWRYFFLGPALTEFLIAICVGWSAMKPSTQA
jgi:hypothetical protein